MHQYRLKKLIVTISKYIIPGMEKKILVIGLHIRIKMLPNGSHKTKQDKIEKKDNKHKNFQT